MTPFKSSSPLLVLISSICVYLQMAKTHAVARKNKNMNKIELDLPFSVS